MLLNIDLFIVINWIFRKSIRFLIFKKKSKNYRYNKNSSYNNKFFCFNNKVYYYEYLVKWMKGVFFFLLKKRVLVCKCSIWYSCSFYK